MSLSELAYDVADVIQEGLTAAGFTTLDPVLYHGPIPDEAECQDGRLTVWWGPITGTDRFPAPASIVGCAGPPMMELTVRWSRCWPIEPKYEAGHSAVAADLLNGAWAGTQAAILETCGKDSSIPQTAGGGVAFVACTPREPKGGVAAVDWKFRVKPVPVASEG